MRHNGQEINFDWSPQSGSAIQWAAFYSDCEHEIETITRGDRITLTYNLYVRQVAEAEMALNSPMIQPRSFSLYGLVETLLATPGFMKEGTMSPCIFYPPLTPDVTCTDQFRWRTWDFLLPRLSPHLQGG